MGSLHLRFVLLVALPIAIGPGAASSLEVTFEYRYVAADYGISYYDPVEERRRGRGVDEWIEAPDAGPFAATHSATVEAFPGTPGSPAVIGYAAQESQMTATRIFAEGAAQLAILNEDFDPDEIAVFSSSFNNVRTVFAVDFTIDVPTLVRLSGFRDASEAFFGGPGFYEDLPLVFDEERLLAPGAYEVYLEAIVLGFGDEDDPVNPNGISPADGNQAFSFELQVVPEPGTLALAASGLALLAGRRARRADSRVQARGFEFQAGRR